MLSLASDQKALEAVNSDMKLISDTITQSKELGEMLQNPTVKNSDKKGLLMTVFKGMNKTTSNLISVLIANKRLALLGDVAANYILLYDEQRGTQLAKVTTAVPLTKELESKVLAKVKELTSKEVELVNVVDPNILGGFILRVGDIQYNASISNKLNNLKREFTLN